MELNDRKHKNKKKLIFQCVNNRKHKSEPILEYFKHANKVVFTPDSLVDSVWTKIAKFVTFLAGAVLFRIAQLQKKKHTQTV